MQAAAPGAEATRLDGAAASLPAATTAYTNSLWDLDPSEQDESPSNPLRQPLKTMTASAAGNTRGTAGGGGAAGDHFHLIASRTTSQEMHVCTTWLGTKKAQPEPEPGSPRIASMPAAGTGVGAGQAEQGPLGLGLGSFGTLLSYLPQWGMGSISETADLGPATAAGLAAGSGAAQPGSDVIELVFGYSAGEEGSGSGPCAAAISSLHISPAHLLARAPPAFLWADSPVPQQERATPAPSEGAPAASVGSSPFLTAAIAASSVDERRQAAELRLPPSPLLQPHFSPSPEQQPQQLSLQQPQQLSLQPHAEGGEQPQELPPSPPAPPWHLQEHQLSGVLPEAVDVAPAASSPSASPSSDSYSPLQAPADLLEAALCQFSGSGDGKTHSSDRGSGSSSSWQRAREEGHVRRSLAHPIFELQPGQGESHWQARGPLADLPTLADSQQQPSLTGSAAGAAGTAKSWTLSCAHIQVDLLAATASTAASPAQPGVLSPLQTAQEQRGQQVRDAPPGQYAELCRRFEELKLSRARKAVRASLKQEQQQQHSTLAGAKASSLLGRIARRLKTDGSRSLRGPLERQQVHLLCLGRIPYNPDLTLHWELYQAVCRTLTGADTVAPAPAGRRSAALPWEELGFSAPNPAAELADTGVLALLFLLCVSCCAPQLAARLLAASRGERAVQHPSGRAVAAEVQQAPSATVGFPLAPVVVEATAWVLRLLRSGELAAEAQRLGSAQQAAELFLLGSLDCFIEEVLHAGPAERALPPPRQLLALLGLAEERACADVAATVQRGADRVADRADRLPR